MIRLFYSILLGISTIINTCNAENRALLVGIDKYQYINPLIGSTNDARAMAKFIQSEWGYKQSQVKILTDEKATAKGILRAFDNWLIRGSKRGDNVLFFYSGHGTYVIDDNDHDETDGVDEALCPVDTRRTRRGKVNLILDDEINQRLKKLRGRKVLVIVDACHSGTITKSAFQRRYPSRFVKEAVFSGKQYRPPVTKSWKKEVLVENQADNIISYTAVAPEQVALVDQYQRPTLGVFTRRFIEAFKNKNADANSDGKITHHELLAYLRRKSNSYCQKSSFCKAGVGLTPQLDIKAAMSDDDIRVWAAINDAMPIARRSEMTARFSDLQVDILPNSRLKPGQRMVVKVNSSKTGYLLLFDASKSSPVNLRRLYPNPYGRQKSIRVIQNKPRIIPHMYSGFRLYANRNSGKRLLVALLVNNPDQLSVLESVLPSAFKQAMQKSANQLDQKLIQVLQQKNVVSNAEYSIATVNYEVR
jgi:hypothetical protein